jgi:hypothetical protein
MIYLINALDIGRIQRINIKRNLLLMVCLFGDAASKSSTQGRFPEF